MFFFPPFTLNLDEDRQTWPPAGSASLCIEQEIVPLFISATWVIRARVDDKVIAESSSTDKELCQGHVRMWARTFIRRHYSDLRSRGVDADRSYLDWGGRVQDLDLVQRP